MHAYMCECVGSMVPTVQNLIVSRFGIRQIYVDIRSPTHIHMRTQNETRFMYHTKLAKIVVRACVRTCDIQFEKNVCFSSDPFRS